MVKRGFRGLGLGLLAALWLWGCTGGGTPAVPADRTQAVSENRDGSTQAASENQNGSTQTAQEAQDSSTQAASENQNGNAQNGGPADRYGEIIDRSGDEGKLTVCFFDLEVGPDAKDKSGDAAVLISPDGKVMLLDAGHPDAGGIVVRTLKDMGIEKIDYLVASHPHIDHIGGVPEVLENFPVEKAYRSYLTYTTQTYQNYVEALETHEIDTESLKTGDSFSFGSQVQVEVLGPEEEIVYPDGFPENSTQFINDHSLVLKFTYGESTALFCGDLYRSAEREYLEKYGDKLQADLVKANHHGKDTSNSKKWIKTVHAKVVGAMGDEVGSMNVYNDYVKEGAEYHMTVNDGFIKIRMDDAGNYEVIDQKDSWMN
ncbi:MAG: MBL fold metallo-hydrolase [Lachnospiraceae bacterium]|nr:MBL fold metallo-hydrolase [Lachnospiraceae bacterium]